MQELCFVAPGKVEWREVPAPRLEGSHEALVRPIAVASCDLDAAIVRGTAPIPGPFALGHESVAEVIDVGDAVTTVQPGHRVIVPFQISCGRCGLCQRGQTAHCSEAIRPAGAAMYGIGPAGGNYGGALSDLLRVPFADAMLVRLPDGVAPSAAASLSDNVADGWRAVAPGLAELPGSRVLILNGGAAGSVGLYATSIALALGADAVDYFDRDPQRCHAARGLGARAETVTEWPKALGPYPIVAECTQEPAGINCALRSTDRAGFCTSTSILYQPQTSVPLLEMYFKGVHLRTGLVNSRAVIPEVLGLVASGEARPEEITSETVGWADAGDALIDYTTKLVVLRDAR